MKFIFRLSFAVIFALCAVSFSLAQGEKTVLGEKYLAEAESLQKTWWVAGNLQKIAENYEKSLAVWRETGDKKREGETLLAAARNLAKFEGAKSLNAKKFAAQAAEIFNALNDGKGEAFAFEIIASIEFYYSLENSKLLYDKALALAQKAKSPSAESYILRSFAVALNDSDYEKSLEMLEKALAIAVEIKEIKNQAQAHFAFGVVYYRIGDYEKSLFHYEQAHKFYKEIGDSSWATTSVENAALVYELLEQPEKVIESYVSALPFRRENGHLTAVADNLTSIAAALIKLNQPEKALENLAEAMKIYEQTANKFGIAWVWRVQGEVNFALTKYEKAIEYFKKSRNLQSELNEQNGVAKAIYWLAKTELARGNLAAAKSQAETVITFIENQLAGLKKQDLRLSFFAARHDYYELYIEILQKLGETEQALEASEKSRAKNLFEILAGKPNPKILSAKEIQNSLDADTALLEFSLGKNSSFVFSVTREKIAVHKLPKADEIELLVQEIRLALSEAGRRNYARFVTSSRRLYEILLKPAESDLLSKKNLLIAPDDSLNYLPFDVLLNDEPQRIGRADFQKLPYAVQNWVIHYTPSASVLAEINNRNSQSAIRNPQSENPQSKNPQFVAFADPVYNQSNKIASSRVRRFVGEAFMNATMPRLADSNREVQSIASDFGDSARLFLRQAATEQNVRRNDELQTARIIHFATHGIVNERLPQYSGLLLTADSSDDGLLQTEEIYDLKLNADLVVLSACRTALGKNLRGEGVIGLTRSFLRAGASSVAATLWQVEDASTADLMIAFYTNLKTSTNKAAALRQAKLVMIKNERLAHPYYWASFVLIGEP
jgi:CHAT domain-containing protein